MALAASWLQQAGSSATRADRRAMARLAGLACDPESSSFAMQYVDRVARADSDAVAARQLVSVASGSTPRFLGPVDRVLLRVAAVLARVPALSGLVVPLARMRMRALVGGLLVSADRGLTAHVLRMRSQGFAQNVNLLGELVLGNEEAERRLEAALDLLANENVEYGNVACAHRSSGTSGEAWTDEQFVLPPPVGSVGEDQRHNGAAEPLGL